MKGVKRILFLNGSTRLRDTLWRRAAFEKAEAYGFQVEFRSSSEGREPDWASELSGFDAAVSSWDSPKVDAALLRYADGLKVLGHAAGSIADVFTEEAYAKGLRVATANPVMAESVAEWSLMATLLAARGLQRYAGFFGASKMRWDARERVRDIRAMTIGVWGFGDISSRFLKMLAPLKPRRVLVCSRHGDPAALKSLGAEPASLEELLAEGDVVHLLAGMTRENFGRIGAKELALMKDGATLVNSGRARLADEKAFVDALVSGRLDAILDVFYKEPMPEDSPLNGLPNVLLTPHNAGMPGRELYVPFILDEFKRFFDGGPMESEISLRRYRTMTVESLAGA